MAGNIFTYTVHETVDFNLAVCCVPSAVVACEPPLSSIDSIPVCLIRPIPLCLMTIKEQSLDQDGSLPPIRPAPPRSALLQLWAGLPPDVRPKLMSLVLTEQWEGHHHPASSSRPPPPPHRRLSSLSSLSCFISVRLRFTLSVSFFILRRILFGLAQQFL